KYFEGINKSNCEEDEGEGEGEDEDEKNFDKNLRWGTRRKSISVPNGIHLLLQLANFSWVIFIKLKGFSFYQLFLYYIPHFDIPYYRNISTIYLYIFILI